MGKWLIRNKCIQDLWILLIIFVNNVQCTNTTLVISKWGIFPPFSSIAILFLVLLSNFIVAGIKSLRRYPVFILNVILFSILFTYIFTGGSSVYSPCFFLRYIQNNLEYLIQNMIRQVIQIINSMLELIFQIYYFCMTFLYFSMYRKC